MNRLKAAGIAMLLFATGGFAQNQTPPVVRTVAGTGDSGYSNDGIEATEASLNRPSDVFISSNGDIYIVDTSNHRVRLVDSDGIIQTVAGSGSAGFSGDGGPATLAELNTPHGVFVDSLGTILICDTRNHRIRAVGSDGTIRTVAGTGEESYSGDGGPATLAALNRPHGITGTGEGAFLIADTNNHRVRFVDASGTIVTVAGTGERGFTGDGLAATTVALNSPVDVQISPDGIYISDRDNHRVRLVAGGAIETVIGNGEAGYSGDGGPATDARLGRPRGLAVSPGRLVVADRDNHVVRMVDSTGAISTVVGTGSAGFNGDERAGLQTSLRSPRGVFLGEGDLLLIADRENSRIRALTLGDGDIQPPVRPEDFNGDGRVDFSDFLDFVARFGSAEGSAEFESRFDLDGDRRVGFGDFLLFVEAFGS